MIPILNIVGIKAFVGPFHLFGAGELDHDLIAVVQPHVLRRNLEPLMKQRFELCHGLVEIDHFFSHVLLLVNDFHLIKKINAFLLGYGLGNIVFVNSTLTFTWVAGSMSTLTNGSKWP